LRFQPQQVHYAASKRRNGASLTRWPLEPTPYSNVSGDTFPPINPRPAPIRQLEAEAKRGGDVQIITHRKAPVET
jgi:hypothetical protein